MSAADEMDHDDSGGSFVSEWYGYRLYPKASTEPEALQTWNAGRCPFLTRATGEVRRCIKNENSQGVCTVSTTTALGRRDWLVCPYRALEPVLLNEAAVKLFGLSPIDRVIVYPAIRFADAAERAGLNAELESGTKVFLYLDQKLGGEISLRKTPRSPEFSIDVTILELALGAEGMVVSRFGALEIQTMDFHGSYKHAVKNLRDGLRLHPAQFALTVDQHQEWIRDRIEGPNLSNVFKRTFYQMAFKFQLGKAEGCVGCLLAIPRAVWESWRHLLGDPEMTGSEHLQLASPKSPLPNPPIAWILPFDLETSPSGGPNRVRLSPVIETSAEAIAYWALEVAPTEALAFATTRDGIAASIKRRLATFWPELSINLRL